MKKVVLSLTLALLTGVSLLAGCASQTQEPEHNPQRRSGHLHLQRTRHSGPLPGLGPRHHPPGPKHPGGI